MPQLPARSTGNVVEADPSRRPPITPAGRQTLSNLLAPQHTLRIGAQQEHNRAAVDDVCVLEDVWRFYMDQVDKKTWKDSVATMVKQSLETKKVSLKRCRNALLIADVQDAEYNLVKASVGWLHRAIEAESPHAEPAPSRHRGVQDEGDRSEVSSTPQGKGKAVAHDDGDGGENADGLDNEDDENRGEDDDHRDGALVATPLTQGGSARGTGSRRSTPRSRSRREGDGQSSQPWKRRLSGTFAEELKTKIAKTAEGRKLQTVQDKLEDGGGNDGNAALTPEERALRERILAKRVNENTETLAVKNMHPMAEHPYCPKAAVRDINEAYVNFLMGEIWANMHEFGSQPAAVVIDPDECPTFADVNISKVKNHQYQYYVIGGNHSTIARQRLSIMYPKNLQYPNTHGIVYAGLDEQELRYVGSLHNTKSQALEGFTFIQKVRFIRKEKEIAEEEGGQ